MKDMIRVKVIGYGTGEVSGATSGVMGVTLLSGIRVRHPEGDVQWIPHCLVGPEAMLLLDSAIQSGGQTELWMTGKDERPYVYGIKIGSERSYSDLVAPAMSGMIYFSLFMGILTLILGIGLLFLLGSAMMWFRASQYKPPYTREEFNAGWESIHPDNLGADQISQLAEA